MQNHAFKKYINETISAYSASVGKNPANTELWHSLIRSPWEEMTVQENNRVLLKKHDEKSLGIISHT